MLDNGNGCPPKLPSIPLTTNQFWQVAGPTHRIYPLSVVLETPPHTAYHSAAPSMENVLQEYSRRILYKIITGRLYRMRKNDIFKLPTASGWTLNCYDIDIFRKHCQAHKQAVISIWMAAICTTQTSKHSPACHHNLCYFQPKPFQDC